MTSKVNSTVRAAIYARVSSDQQAQEQTIESQVAALCERVVSDGLPLDDELCFLDDGVNGSTLMRPALERLRDMAYVGGFEKLYVHSPDRLARRYAYQVLLVDELTKHGVELVFLNRAIGVSPEEDLLLQMQGMFAEYERAKIMERTRRGRRYAAKRGSVSVLSGAPYGYRYITRCEGDGQAAYDTDASEQVSIPVPAIVSEELFAVVQTQLTENRQRGRETRRGATYLLQGLLECACCSYAYYGNKVTRYRAGRKASYVYYRCTGSDSHRLGGQRICDNKQVRTDKLDEAVW